MKLLPLIVTALLCLQLAAQEKQFQIGIKGGWNLADLNNDFPEFKLTSINAFHFGLVAKKQLTNQWSLAAELQYSRKGGQEAEDLNFGMITENDYEVRFDYLTLPILASYHFENFSIDAGIEFGQRINLKVSGSNIDNFVIAESLWENKFDWGPVVGLSYQIKPLFFSVRYIHGLNDLSGDIQFTDVNGEPIPSLTGGRYRNSVFQVSLGTYFSI